MMPPTVNAPAVDRAVDGHAGQQLTAQHRASFDQGCTGAVPGGGHCRSYPALPAPTTTTS